jgi:hypothetical protein
MKLRTHLLSLLSSALLASATHFRFGLITYDQVSPSTTGTDFTMNMQQAWRWSAWGNPAVNTQVSIVGLCYDSANWVYNTWTVNAVNSANDWYIATWTPTRVTYTLPAGSTASKFTAYTYDCFRISTLLNNHDGYWSTYAQVYVSKNGAFKSMKSSIVPITTLIVNKVNTFTLNVLTYQNEKTTFRIATVGEASLGQGWTPPTGLTVGWNTGLITWTPPATGLYTVQVIVKGNTATPTSINDDSSLQSWFGIDWILQSIDPTSKVCKRFCSNLGSLCSNDGNCVGCSDVPLNRVPYCDTNTAPYFTTVTNAQGAVIKTAVRDADNSISLVAAYQTQLKVTINLQDDDPEDFITPGNAALPSGVSVTTVSNVQGSGSATLTWTPGDNDLGGAVICFTASDSLGHNTIGQLCLVITVGQGTLTANGTGLTAAIAGDYTTFSVQNALGRTHSLSFQGVGNTYTGSVVDLNTNNYWTSGVQYENYQGRYNLSTAGLYVLTVADTTSSVAIKPQSVVSVLTVSPNITSPANCVVYEQGSTGLSGGLVNRTVIFYVHPFDAFGNKQTLQRSDSFWFTLTYNNTNGVSVTTSSKMSWETLLVGGVTDYRYNASYVIPNLAFGNTTYILQVFYNKTSTGPSTLVGTYYPQVVAKGFTCNLNSPTFIAGKSVQFYFTVNDLTDSEAALKTFTGSINGIVATVSYTGGTQFNFVAAAGSFTKAGTYSRGIVLSSAGLGSSSSSTSNSTGTVTLDFFVDNDVPASTYSTVAPSDVTVKLLDIEADDQSLQIVVDLMDQYGNPCTVGDFDVGYSVEVAGRTPQVGNATRSTIKDLFFFSFTPNVAGTFTITITVYINGAGTSFDLPVQNGQVVPGPFNTKASSYAPSSSAQRDTVAGYSMYFTVFARDRFSNARTIDGDQFNATLNRKKYGTKPALSFPIQSERRKVADDQGVLYSTEQYDFLYSSNYSGSYQAQVNYFDSGSYAQFATLDLTIWAGKAYGASITALNADYVKYNTRAEIAIQTVDVYGNVVEDLTGGRYMDSNYTLQTYNNVSQAYIVEVISVNQMAHTYYMAGYCPKTSTAPYLCPTSYLESSTDDKKDWEKDIQLVNGVKSRNTTTIDKNLYSDGFFRVFYNVPKITFGQNNYTVKVYFLNKKIVGNYTSWTKMLQDPSTQLLKTLVFHIAASDAASDSATSFNYFVVFGAAAGCFFVSGVGYGAFRLGRYRPKYKQEKARADENEQILDEMRDEGNLAGGRDYMAVGGAQITMNPLHQTFKNEALLREEFAKVRNPALATATETQAVPSDKQIKEMMDSTTI